MRSDSFDAVRSFVMPYVDDPGLRRITLTAGRVSSAGDPQRALIRPVMLRGERRLQIVTYDGAKARTTNIEDSHGVAVMDLLGHSFRHITIELSDMVLQGRSTKKGGLVTSHTRVDQRPLDLAHDRHKRRLVSQDAPFLESLGLASGGRVKPTGQAKFRQINEFIRLLDRGGTLGRLQPGDRVSVVDLGCGNAYLTFAVYHHLTANRQLDCALVGVDRNREVVSRANGRARQLGWRRLEFRTTEIEQYEPDERPDIVISLHACDDASDHALASMVKWRSELGLVAPCCHHHLQGQLASANLDPAESLLVRHGILRERVGDVLTDTTRAAILRLLGYDVDVVEFVAARETPKNLLIRAVDRDLPVPTDLIASYHQLLARWSVRPRLHDLLASRLSEVADAGEAPAATRASDPIAATPIN